MLAESRKGSIRAVTLILVRALDCSVHLPSGSFLAVDTSLSCNDDDYNDFRRHTGVC